MTEKYMCAYTGKEITAEVCPDCSRFDCAVAFNEMVLVG